MKLTEDPEKQTLPGSKAAFRLLGADGEALPRLPLLGGPSPVPRPPALLLARTQGLRCWICCSWLRKQRRRLARSSGSGLEGPREPVP